MPEDVGRTSGGASRIRPQFNHLMAVLKLEVSEHVRGRRGRLFPLLAAACPPRSWTSSATRSARRRRRPVRTDTPPGNKILGPGAGLVDRARDLLSGRGKS